MPALEPALRAAWDVGVDVGGLEVERVGFAFVVDAAMEFEGVAAATAGLKMRGYRAVSTKVVVWVHMVGETMDLSSTPSLFQRLVVVHEAPPELKAPHSIVILSSFSTCLELEGLFPATERALRLVEVFKPSCN